MLPIKLYIRSFLSICCYWYKIHLQWTPSIQCVERSYSFPKQRLSLLPSHPFSSYPNHLRGNSIRNETIECDSLCQETLPRGLHQQQLHSYFSPVTDHLCRWVFFSLPFAPLNRKIDMQLLHLFIQYGRFRLSIHFDFKRLHQHFYDTVADSLLPLINPFGKVLSSTILL